MRFTLPVSTGVLFAFYNHFEIRNIIMETDSSLIANVAPNSNVENIGTPIELTTILLKMDITTYSPNWIV